VAKKIKVNPSAAAASLDATQDVTVKPAGLFEVSDVKSEVKKTVHSFRIAV
jgi:hypothetical protein